MNYKELENFLEQALAELEDITETTTRQAEGKTSRYGEQYLEDWNKYTKKDLYGRTITTLLNRNDPKLGKH